MTRFQKLAVAASVAAYLLVLSGGAVRATGSGLSCGGWPLCHGGVVPPAETGALVVYAHRLIAALVGVLVVATALAAWVGHRRRPAVLIPALAGAAFLIMQITLDGFTALAGRSPAPLMAHLAISMALFASLVLVAVGAFAPDGRVGQTADRIRATEGFALLAAATALAIYALILTGSYVTGQGAGFACRGWPLCNGQIFPGGDRLADIHAFHRLFAAGAGVLVAVLVWQAMTRQRNRANRLLVGSAVAAGVVFLAQVFVGAGNVWLRLDEPVRIAHLGVAALVWGALVLTTGLAFSGSRLPRTAAEPDAVGDHARPRTARVGGGQVVAAYVRLTKPRIIELLLVTTVPAMVLADKGMPSLLLIAGTILGGMLTAGGANAINCYIDRDIDEVMGRTRRRPLPSHQVPPERALAFGVGIGVVGFLELAIVVNLLAAVLSVAAILFYVFVYTLWLKRSTDQNIVIGGAAGAVPPLVGWAAVTGRLDLPALVLFAIVVLWTPPHFWALALRYRSDYEAAHVPMLPVVRGEAETRRQIFGYSLVLVLVTVLLYVTGGAGIVYLVVALALGAALIRMAYRLLRHPEAFPVMKLFSYSITYLAALFTAMILDQAVRALV